MTRQAVNAPSTLAARLSSADCGYGGPPVLAGVSLDIEPGEFVGAVGPSGSGKTTLVRALTGQCRVTAGEVTVFGSPVRAGRPAGRIGYVPQLDTVDVSFPISAEWVVLQGLSVRRWPTAAQRATARDMLDQLGIGHVASRPVGSLSGGELQRVFLGRALVGQPDLLLLDEPTASVDLRTRHDVLHLLGGLHGAGMAILLTTHDLNFVAAHLPRVVCLADGSIVADGSPLKVFTPEVLAQTYGAEVRVVYSNGMVFVADPTHILTPGHHHDQPGHPVDFGQTP